MRVIFCLYVLSVSIKPIVAFVSTSGSSRLPKSFCKVKESLVLQQAAALTREEELDNNTSKNNNKNSVEVFFKAWNDRKLVTAIDQFAIDATFEDASYPTPFEGKEDINRHFSLLADNSLQLFVLDDIAIDEARNKVAAFYHVEEEDGKTKSNSRHIAFFTLNESTGQIQTVYDTVEPVNKAGEVNLKILSFVGKYIEKSVEEESSKNTEKLDVSSSKQLLIPEKFFDAYNRRNMDDALQLFDKDCIYDDTVFPNPLNGITQLKNHMEVCERALPSTFQFIVDDIADGGDCLGVRWHVENQGQEMKFTRGNSFYTIDNGLVKTVVDEIEPAVLKKGGVQFFFEYVSNKIQEEPVRIVPLTVWALYMYIVFFSDGILPGANALQLEQRTWEEVRDLSINFFFVSPLLNLPFAPTTVHPILEGVFNLLLSWAALFAGFLSDDRSKNDTTNKQNIFPMIPAVVGMQFLTSAFLLPYLVLRSTEKTPEGEKLTLKDLDTPAKLTESKLFASALGLVGLGSVVWGSFARASTYGSDRIETFWKLMSIDRVGSSFLVDLAIFAAFQGWLVDDDLKRRGVKIENMGGVRNAAKFVPFFGLVAYMILRPSFDVDEQEK